MTGIEKIRASFQSKRTLFIPYVPFGYPSIDESVAFVRQLTEAGADIIELGIPFSDPMADGKVIQHASQVSLSNGATFKEALRRVKELAAEIDLPPLLLMGYYNIFFNYGLEQLAADAEGAGVDGFVIPDLPIEESAQLRSACGEHGLGLINFVAPTTSLDRMKAISETADGFIYVVTRSGVTGRYESIPDELQTCLQAMRRQTQVPLVVGFGISTVGQVEQLAEHVDGIVIGSAIVEKMGQSIPDAMVFCSEIVATLAGPNRKTD